MPSSDVLNRALCVLISRRCFRYRAQVRPVLPMPWLCHRVWAIAASWMCAATGALCDPGRFLGIGKPTRRGVRARRHGTHVPPSEIHPAAGAARDARGMRIVADLIVGGIAVGSWPDWIAAAGTSLAFVVAAFAYRRDVKVRRQSQARLVYSKLVDYETFHVGTIIPTLPDGAVQGCNAAGTVELVFSDNPDGTAVLRTTAPAIRVVIDVHNLSDELIGPAKIQVVDAGRNAILNDFCCLTGVIEPHSTYRCDFVFQNDRYPAGEPSLGTTVIFRDATGGWWRRHLSDLIEAVHDDPENGAFTPAQREQWAANARAFGSTPTPEPFISRRVRWHRYWRRRRGLSPIP